MHVILYIYIYIYIWQRTCLALLDKVFQEGFRPPLAAFHEYLSDSILLKFEAHLRVKCIASVRLHIMRMTCTSQSEAHSMGSLSPRKAKSRPVLALPTRFLGRLFRCSRLPTGFFPFCLPLTVSLNSVGLLSTRASVLVLSTLALLHLFCRGRGLCARGFFLPPLRSVGLLIACACFSALVLRVRS